MRLAPYDVMVRVSQIEGRRAVVGSGARLLRQFVGALHQAGLAAGSLIFMDDSALGGLIDRFAGDADRLRSGSLGGVRVDRGARLLDVSLHRRLRRDIPQMVLAGLDDIFLYGLDIGHESTSFERQSIPQIVGKGKGLFKVELFAVLHEKFWVYRD